MKKIILGICLLAVTQFTFSQDKKGKISPEERAKKQTEKLNQTVKLSPDQHDKIYAINLNSAKKVHEIHSDKNLTDEAKKSAIKEERQASNQLEKAILTKEQMALLKAERKENRKDKEDKAN